MTRMTCPSFCTRFNERVYIPEAYFREALSCIADHPINSLLKNPRSTATLT
jgi:hypothetical protein